MPEPENLILELVRSIRKDLAGTNARITGLRTELKSDIADLRNEIADVRSEGHSLRADVASDMLLMRKEHSDQISGLRRAVMGYHTSVIRYSILIGEHATRISRLASEVVPGDPH